MRSPLLASLSWWTHRISGADYTREVATDCETDDGTAGRSGRHPGIAPMNSYSIDDLYAFTPTVEPSSFERLNPLTETGSLDEAELIDVRLSAQRLRGGMILDLGPSLCFRGPNTALVVLTSVGKVSWDTSDS